MPPGQRDFMSSVLQKLCRRKQISLTSPTDDEDGGGLKRVLTTTDLTLLSVGNTLGVGMYVLSGVVAKTEAGPAVILSFAIAGFACMLSGFCYAEFSKIPSAGSAYAYSYVAIGELVAFIVGWNMILEYSLSIACIGRAYTAIIDTITGEAMIAAFKKCCVTSYGYFDFFGLVLIILASIGLILGAKISSVLNNVFTALNLGIVGFVVMVGIVFADFRNWSMTKEDIKAAYPDVKLEAIGEGGFFPFGFQGVLRGSSTCFFAFVGFDVIAASAEEAKDPRKSIPRAISLSLLIVFIAYISSSAVVTLMVPYFLQNQDAPLAEAFHVVGFPPGRWCVVAGCFFGYGACLISSLHPMPRIIYAMAKDGVIFRFLGTINLKYGTPVVATVLSGIFSGAVAAVFDVPLLVDMMSIGTLTAYTIVSISVLCLRYRPSTEIMIQTRECLATQEYRHKEGWYTKFLPFTCIKDFQKPTADTGRYAECAIWSLCTFVVAFSLSVIHGELMEGNIIAICICPVSAIAILCTLGFLAILPQVKQTSTDFQVPFVPWIPATSIIINILLMMKLPTSTWIRFGIWMSIGLVVYTICLCMGTTDQAYQENLNQTYCQRQLERTKESYEEIVGDCSSTLVQHGMKMDEDGNESITRSEEDASLSES